ncbi:hypothetical protein [Methylovirgula sp. 4M-Z18]|uniref:hypothetical protein n=1 Tax=Methylovirgula sp. 4M-Z18 TaxID=2293567 RepID=UPI000E2E9AF4|nr:hypothetical protein [Methylovirgula sp. 4M-Z18]RFB78814.1 hypothetical protein DYH55_13315 [Methylovirgula sp. 4M-Z18]
MIRRLLLLALVLPGLVAASTSGVSARPILPAEKRFLPYTGDVPACDEGGILSTIQSRFSQKESYYWNSSLTLQSFDRIKQLGFRSDGADYIPRRYCAARVLASDNKYRQVVYQIGEDLGMIGWGPGVTWCVEGLDRDLSYGLHCRTLRPHSDVH